MLAGGKRAFTLIELIMVIMILGVLAGVAIPKFVNLMDKANRASCDANVGAINTAVLLQYAKKLAEDSANHNWLENLGSEASPLVLADAPHGSWFVDEKVPTCPFGENYRLIRGVCQKHSH